MGAFTAYLTNIKYNIKNEKNDQGKSNKII